MLEIKKRTTPHYPKSYMRLLVLCWLVGIFGIHRLYAGYKRIGFFQMFTLGGFFIWWLVDLVSICFNTFRDKYGNEFDDYNGTFASLVLTGTVLIFMAVGLLSLPAWIEGLM